MTTSPTQKTSILPTGGGAALEDAESPRAVRRDRGVGVWLVRESRVAVIEPVEMPAALNAMGCRNRVVDIGKR